MKKKLSIVLTLLMVLTLALPVQAAESPTSAAAVEKMSATEFVKLADTMATGVAVADTNAKVEKLADKTVMVAACKEAAAIGGTVSKAFDLNYTGTIPEGGVEMKFSLPAPAAGMTYQILHRKSDGTWEKLPTTVVGTTVSAVFTSFSPVVIVQVAATAAVAPAADMTKSPKTGETDLLWLEIAIMMACFAGSAVLIKKARDAR